MPAVKLKQVAGVVVTKLSWSILGMLLNYRLPTFCLNLL